MEEIARLKYDLTSWFDKWNLLRVKKLSYIAHAKILLSKNRKLVKQNKISKTRAVRFKAKLDEARRNVPIQLSIESSLKI